MRSCSAEFKELWQKKIGNAERRRVGYKRLYYNGSAYVNEADWTYLYESDFVGWGEIPWELDSPLQNVFSSGIVTLLLNNERNQWVESDAPPSFFAADDVAPLGYKLYKTLFQLQVGNTLSSGTVEWVSQFTGYALRSMLVSSSGIAEIRLESKGAFLLEKSDASVVHDTITLENCSPATGDGANLIFKTTSTGVGEITDLQVNGVSYLRTDYSVDNAGTVESPNNDGKAIITISDAPGLAPGMGQTVKVSLVKWKQAQKIDTLLGLIADAAGIGSGDRDLSPIQLAVAAAGTHTIDTQSDWNAGTKTFIDSVFLAGSIFKALHIDYFEDEDLTSNPAWTTTAGSPVIVANAWGDGINMMGNADSASVQTGVAVTQSGTAFKYRFRGSVGANALGDDALALVVMSSNVTGDGNGYRLNIVNHTAIPRYEVRLERLDAGVITILGTYMATAADTNPRSVIMERDSGGNWTVTVDGVEVLSGITDSNYTTGSYVVTQKSDATLIGQIAYDPMVDGVWESAAIDLGGVPSALGILSLLVVLNSGIVLMETKTAPDSAGSPGAFEAYAATAANGQMASTPQQWLKIRLTLTNVGWDSPRVDRLIVNFSTSDITVSLADLSNLTGQQAFEQYAALVDYETGDDGDGKRFFRSKVPSETPALELTQENGIIEVLEYDPGHDDVRTVAQVTFGEHQSTFDAAAAGESSPTSEDQYGRIPLQLDMTGVLLENDINLADARAELGYSRNKLPKRKLRIRMWACAWLEDGDRIIATVIDQPRAGRDINPAIDPLATIDDRLTIGDPKNVLALRLPMKMLQYRPNYDTDEAEALLEEILS